MNDALLDGSGLAAVGVYLCSLLLIGYLARRARGGEGLLDVLAVRVRRARDALAVERRDEEVRSVAVEERGEREREREVTLADEEDAHAAVVAVRQACLLRGALELFASSLSVLPLAPLGHGSGVRPGVAALDGAALPPLQRLAHGRAGDAMERRQDARDPSLLGHLEPSPLLHDAFLLGYS